MIKQFVPQEFCLGCQGCCRFKEQRSVWSPCLLDEEVQELLDKKGIPAVYLSLENRLMLIPSPSGENFLCPFLKLEDNKCKIYESRPFECRLYPFLISIRAKKVLLTVDINCPYVKDKLETPELKEYVKYLTSFLNSPSQLKLLKDNPQIIRAYEDVLDVVALDISHGAE